jgi:hypothetical protein
MSNDWLPREEAKFISLMHTWDDQLSDSAKRTAYGWNVDECSDTTVVIGKFFGALDKYLADKTHLKCMDKDEAKDLCATAAREFAMSSIRGNKKMTASQKLDLGVRTRSGPGVPQERPKDRVASTLHSHDGDHTISADYHIEGTKKKGKGHYHAAEGRYWIRKLGEDGPVDPNEDGWKSVASTSSPWKVKAGGEHRGEMFYQTMRWENFSTGKEDGEAGKGEWSPIKCIIVT